MKQVCDNDDDDGQTDLSDDEEEEEGTEYESEFHPGDFVWVKLGRNWFPAQIITLCLVCFCWR